MLSLDASLCTHKLRSLSQAIAAKLKHVGRSFPLAVFEKMCTFCFSLVYVGKSKKEYMKKKTEKENFKENPEKLCFLGGCEENGLFCKNVIFRKIGKHYLCSEGKKTRIFVATICFWKMVLVFVAIPSGKTL